MTKKVWIAVAGVGLAVVAVSLLRPSGVEVTTAFVERGALEVTIPVEGRTRARDLYTVAAPISGRIARLSVDEGQTVEAGDLLVRIFPAPQDPRTVATARADLRAAEAQESNARVSIQQARATAEQAERDVERRRPLLEMGAISSEALEQAELAAEVAGQRLAAAGAALTAAEAAVEASRARLIGLEAGGPDAGGFDIRAPVSGRVLRVPDESERVIPAGAPLLELANTGGLEVVLEVLSEDAVNIAPGHPLRVSQWGGDGVLEGTVRYVTLAGYTKISALGVEEQRVDVVADLHDIPETLGTGYRVQGEVVVWVGEATVVPTSALFRLDGAWQLFAVRDGRAVRTEVEVGRRNETSAEITGGLDEGAEVVLFPSEEVDDGVSVRATPAAGATR